MPDESPQPCPIGERIEELYRRLSLLPQAGSAESALQQLCETLDQVEDAFSGVVKKSPPPPLNMSDGRMYCPSEDHVLRRADGSILALTRGHRIEIAAGGRMRIINKVTLEAEFEK